MDARSEELAGEGHGWQQLFAAAGGALHATWKITHRHSATTTRLLCLFEIIRLHLTRLRLDDDAS